jgi:hypothetical protein
MCFDCPHLVIHNELHILNKCTAWDKNITYKALMKINDCVYYALLDIKDDNTKEPIGYVH